MKKKIIHISTHYYPVNGGQQIYIDNLKKYLIDYEHIVVQIGDKDVVYPDHVYPVEIPYKNILKAFSFYVYNASVGKLILDLIATDEIDVNNDIFLCHYAFHYSIVKNFKNVLILSHGVEWDGPGNTLKKLYHSHRKKINQRLIREDSVKIISNDLNYFLQLGLQNTNDSHFFSEIKANKWLVPNSVNTEIFEKKELTNSYFDSPAIVIPRNIVPQRGMEFVIRALSELKGNGSFMDYKLYIVGVKYDIAYYNSLVSLIDRLNLNDDVVFYGSIPYEETPLMYNSADLVVIFSLFREGTSLAALEAMACSTVVVSTDIGGLKDLPTIKANRDNLASVMASSLKNADQISVGQMDFVTKNFSSRNWISSWSTILNTFN